MTWSPSLVAVGMLLVLLEVPGFGIDFANDIVGHLVVAGAVLRSPAPGRRLVAGLAVLAAAVSLFGYGGPASQLVVLSDDLWTVAVAAEMLTGSSVFVAVLWSLSTVEPTRRTRLLPLVAALLALATVGWALVVVLGDVAGGILLQLFGVMIGLLRGLTVVAAFHLSALR